MTLSKEQIAEIAATISVDYASLAAFIEVESSGKGFSPVTGKIIIQFEPHIFAKGLQAAKVDYTMTVAMENGRKKYTIVSGNNKIVNSVEGQTAEWVAFDTATAIHPRSAKMATSIGLGQVMGFNHAKLGFKTVEEMWSEFEKGEYQQVVGMTFFIKNTPGLLDALKAKNWAKVAMLYNGADYAVNKYDVKLGNAYAKYKKIQDAPAGSAQPAPAARSMEPVGSEGIESSVDGSEDDIELSVESVLSAHSFMMASPDTSNGGPAGSTVKSAKSQSAKTKAGKALSAKKSSGNAKPKKTANLKSAVAGAATTAKAGQSPKRVNAFKTTKAAKPSNATKAAKPSNAKQAAKLANATKGPKAKPAPMPTTSKKALAPKKPLK